MLGVDLFTDHNHFLIISICYFIGSIPSGLLISLILKKNDPRLVGSKNIGATNITRTSGWKLGLLTLICDVLKGYIPILYLIQQNIQVNMPILFIFLGHLFPIWIKFKGGKGIAVIIGCLSAFNLLFGFFFIFIWIINALLTKYSSLSALVASFCTLIFIFLKNSNFFSIMSIIVVMIFLKHIPNIKRLLNGTETKINLKNKN